MGAEQLEEGEMEPFVEAVKGFASGKTIGLFGSYGWGDGEWMRTWVADMESAGARVLGGEDAICQEAPNEEAQEACIDLGKDLDVYKRQTIFIWSFIRVKQWQSWARPDAERQRLSALFHVFMMLWMEQFLWMMWMCGATLKKN